MAVMTGKPEAIQDVRCPGCGALQIRGIFSILYAKCRKCKLQFFIRGIDDDGKIECGITT